MTLPPLSSMSGSGDGEAAWRLGDRPTLFIVSSHLLLALRVASASPDSSTATSSDEDKKVYRAYHKCYFHGVPFRVSKPSVYQSSRTCRAAAAFGTLHTAPPGVPNPQPLVAGGMLTYPGDPRGNPPQHGPLSSLSTSAAPFTVAGPHPAGPTFPNPSFAVPAAPSLNAAGEWGDPSLMEAPARFMAPGAAAAASLGYTGEVFDSAPYGIYSEYHFGNFVDPHPLRSENSELISEKRPGTCGETSEALSNGFGLSSCCQQQSAFASIFLDGIGAESVGCYYPRPVPNQDPSGSASSLISGAPAVPVKSLTSEGVLGNISSQAAEAEKTADTQTLAEEGQEHCHCHPDAEQNMLQMSDSSSRNRAIFLELMHNLSVVLLSTCKVAMVVLPYMSMKKKI
ncbi:hypothetical protein ACQ4PT_014052 [Festuca glaucescens]